MATQTVEAVYEPCGAESWRNPFDMYAALRDHDPVHYAEWGDFYVLSRFQDVFDAARDTAQFSSAQGLTFTYGEREALGMEIHPIVMMDPPDHTKFRRLVSKGFTPRQVAEIEPFVREFIVERLEGLIADGGGDIVEQLFKPLPSMVVAHYLGVPREDWDHFDSWTQRIVAANALGNVLEAQEAVGELVMYFGELAERRKTDPGDDTISHLVQAADGDDDAPILDILGFAFTMVTGGNDTTTGLLGGASVIMTEQPEQRDALVADPSLIPNAVEEFLRLTAPVQGLARTATTDIKIEGVTIPEGKKALLLYGSANRDEREYGDDAARCDVTRQVSKHVSFSYGSHFCLGASAARLQAAVALEELLSRCPTFSVDIDAGVYAPGAFVRRHESLPFSPA